jgi:hypothetical protein
MTVDHEYTSLRYWEKIFEGATIYTKHEPLTEELLADELKSWSNKLTQEEVTYLAEYMSANEIKKSTNYFRDKTLPKSYINFLRFCNIDEMVNGERYFQFFSIKAIREYTIAYIFPKWMNGGVSFAAD